MELYSRAISPFAARVRVSILAKDLPIRVIDAPDVTSAAFAEINPYRRVPVLILDDGTALPESEVIVEYLEDRYPQVCLRPADIAQRARTRLIARAAELYLFPAVVEIFRARATAAGDPARLADLFAALDGNVGQLEALMDRTSPSWHVCGASLTLGDGALAPFLAYVDQLTTASGRDLLDGRPRLAQFWDGARRDPVLSSIMQEIARSFGVVAR